MRVIHINLCSILPVMNTAKSDFVMWVNVPHRDVPEELHVIKKARFIGLKLVYPHDQKTFTKNATNSTQIYLGIDSNRIAGFDLPINGFRSELRNLIGWLQDEEKKFNVETIRMNWRLIVVILQLEADNLLMPPQ